MNTRLPGNLSEIFPLRFRLREELRFLQAGEVVIAEKVRSGERYTVEAWQHEMLMSFNGKTTFEAAAKRAYTIEKAIHLERWTHLIKVFAKEMAYKR